MPWSNRNWKLHGNSFLDMIHIFENSPESYRSPIDYIIAYGLEYLILYLSKLRRWYDFDP